jgi:hypothetical protein
LPAAAGRRASRFFFDVALTFYVSPVGTTDFSLCSSVVLCSCGVLFSWVIVLFEYGATPVALQRVALVILTSLSHHFLTSYHGISFFSPFFLLLDSFGGSVVVDVPSVAGVLAVTSVAGAVVGVLAAPSVAGAVVVPFAVPSALELAAGSVALPSLAGAAADVSSLAPLVFVGCAGSGSPGFTTPITAFDPGAPPPLPMLEPLPPVNVSVPG